jgi:hypothetical protein
MKKKVEEIMPRWTCIMPRWKEVNLKHCVTMHAYETSCHDVYTLVMIITIMNS